MEICYTIIVFIYGTLLGSFYNVVGYRLPNNLSIVKPGSFCPKCKHELKWYELIPVFSFLIQKGKCRKCKCKISLFYPFIELITGILFAVSYLVFGFSYEFFISIAIVSFLVIVIVSDVNYLVIPDEVTLFFVIYVVILQFCFNGWKAGLFSILYGLFLFVVMYLIMLLGNKLFKEESLGGGDVKLMFFVGSILSPIDGLFEIFLSSFIALPFALFTYFSKQNRAIPFGPFILIALLIMYLTNFDFINFFGSIFK